MHVGNFPGELRKSYFLSNAAISLPQPMFLKRNFQPIRRSHRQWINTSVDVFAGATHLHGLGVNLSDGGMCFFSVSNLRVGTQVEIQFVPPEMNDAVRFSGIVRHKALYLYGIEFLLADAEEKRSSASNFAAMP